MKSHIVSHTPSSIKSLICLCLILIMSLSNFIAWGEYRQITTRNMFMTDGLTNNTIKSIAQDKKGFMWFASTYGVNRYDGYNVTRYFNEIDKESLINNNTLKVAADTLRGKIWIGTRYAGISVFDCQSESFQNFKSIEDDLSSLSSDMITDIYIDQKGKVWIGTKKGLDLYDYATNKFFRYNSSTMAGFPEGSVETVTGNRNGIIYLGHGGGGFSVFNTTNNSITNFTHNPANSKSIPSNYITSLHVGSSGRVWIGSFKGLSVYDSSKQTFLNFCSVPGLHSTVKSVILDIEEASDGNIYVGTPSDMCYFQEDAFFEILSGQKDVDYTYIQDPIIGVTNPSVLDIHEDRYGNLWIGTNGGGVGFINANKPMFKGWRFNKVPGSTNGLTDKEVFSICHIDNHTIWIATDGGGVNINEDGINCESLTPDNSPLRSYNYSSIIKDSDDRVWMGANNRNIDIYDTRTGEFHYYEVDYPSANVTDIFEDRNRNIWIGTTSGIEVYNLDTKTKLQINKTNSPLPSNGINCFAQDDIGRIWIGTSGFGYFIYDPVQKQIAQSIKCPIDHLTVNQILIDPLGVAWLATDSGLACVEHYDFDNMRIFRMHNGLASDMIFSMTQDREGNLWMSTNVGISCLRLKEKRFLNFTSLDSALPGPYLPNSVSQGPDYTIYFGGMNGVTYFNVKDFTSLPTVPKVEFTDVKTINGSDDNLSFSSIPISGNKVEIKHDQDVFTVMFSVMNNSLTSEIEYSYNMAGLDDEWINIRNENSISFHKLPYRKYELKVKARIKNEPWPQTYSSLTIDIKPPFWLSAWAFVIYLTALIMLLAVMAIQYRKYVFNRSLLEAEKREARQQKELNEERVKFYTNITHELRTPLTLILGPLDDLRNQEGLNQNQIQKLDLVQKNASRLLNLVSQILELRKVECDLRRLNVARLNICELVEEIAMKFKEAGQNSDVEFKIVTQTQKPEIYLDAEVIGMIVDNLLSNAFKYTKKGRIELRVSQTQINGLEYTAISVSDTGIGIPKDDQQKIFEYYQQATGRENQPGFGIGLALVKNLAQLHQGEILLESDPQMGSTFTLRLLTDNTYPDANHIESRQLEPETSDKENEPKYKILVIEDEQDMRQYISTGLQEHYLVRAARDGEEAMEMIREECPDLIVSDIMMPGINGIELCSKIKSQESTSHIPIILLSAKDNSSDKSQGYLSGADSYLTKPFSMTLLHSRVENLLLGRKKIELTLSASKSFRKSLINASLSNNDKEFIDKLIGLISNNMGQENLDAANIGKMMGMSYSSFYRKVKNLSDMSPSEFIKKVRLRKAEELLLSGKYTI